MKKGGNDGMPMRQAQAGKDEHQSASSYRSIPSL